MLSTRSSYRFVIASVVAAAFIIYGSLYPFAFHGGSIAGAVRTLFLSRNIHDQPLSGLIANIMFYVPLGIFCTAAQNGARPVWLRVMVTTAIGALLCIIMETIQFFDAGRVSTLTDVYPNVIGALLGAFLALPLVHWLDRRLTDTYSPARQTAALLLLLFLAYRLFPYVPSLDLHAYWRAIKPVLLHPLVRGFDVGSYAVMWAVVAALLADLSSRAYSRWLIAASMVAVLFCKVIIVHNHLSLSELIALPVAVFAWQVLSSLRRSWSAGALAVLLALVVLGDRLLPFDWQTTGHAFGWVPFASILHGSMAVNAQSLAEKVFLYSSLIWLFAVAGLRYAVAGGLVASGLFVTSMIETHLSGRSAEITDTVIAVGATVALYWLEGSHEASRGQTGPKPGNSATARDREIR